MAKKAVQLKLKDVLTLHYNNMSKLYANVSSEKASKGQGGNHKISGNLTADINGENVEVLRYGIKVNGDGSYDLFIEPYGEKQRVITI